MFVEALVRLLVAEHKKNPLKGTILSLGKQSVCVPLSKIKEIFNEFGCKINPDFKEKYDTTTRFKEGCLDDESFISMFGNVNYQTMDVSSYEQASIVHNLNFPIPKELEGKFDYIIDGGTFDHLFDLKTSFENITKLLKPGGRIFQWNAASNYANAGYLSFSADFFYDYYTLNNFADCRTFFAMSHIMQAQNWCFYEFIPPKEGKSYTAFKPTYFSVMTIVLATKGANSTCDRMPVQAQYRDASLANEYKKNSEKFESNLVGWLALKTLPLKQVKMPLKHKLLYLCEAKPCRHSYHKMGWM